MVENKIDLTIQDQKGYSHLHNICYSQNFSLDMLKYLVENNTDLTIKNKDNRSPLHEICCNEKFSLDMLKYLVEKNIDLTMKGQNAYSPLHEMCGFHPNFSFDMLKYLIENNIDLTIKNSADISYCQSPLQVIQPNLLQRVGEIGKIKQYFHNIINKNSQENNLLSDIKKLTKLVMLATNNIKKLSLEKLVIGKNDIDLVVFINLSQLLSYAKFNTKDVESFFDDKRGADVHLSEALSKINLTEKHFTQPKYFKVLVALLKKANIFGANLPKIAVSDCIDNEGFSAPIEKDDNYSLLQWLCLHCTDIEKIKIFAACYGDNLSATLGLKDGFGRNCFHLAALRDNMDVLKYLIELDLQKTGILDSSEKDNKNVLHYVCDNENVDIETIKRLIEAGVGCKQKDSRGKTPLDYLKENKKFTGKIEEIKEFIEEYEEKHKNQVSFKTEISNNEISENNPSFKPLLSPKQTFPKDLNTNENKIDINENYTGQENKKFG